MASKREPKRESSGKKPTTRKTSTRQAAESPSTAAPDVGTSAAGSEVGPSMTDGNGSGDGATNLSEAPASAATQEGVQQDPALRRQLIAIEAYYLAERRGFAAGHEVEDWKAAEQVVESRHPSR